ncbi:hypothetical protein HN592_03500 [Candidatus Woesearchaeota archaeon]|jgi:hypothetical protein|nr:hypothetical protein [Candidatus Woesearchaeota archaeon]MBT4368277.1 hypothetical protein [Candidatus Woesearchaeota archaeon]MBT4712766.1 hypothetical protein [Candidatus Woesearchaeota archaeon]MBT6639678.1 hypothetical protein [Candidatus Woesearchaeota archaeon]MBT7133850.1 hypothetical protein [Candidatus Woesearchaeota archaeon]
MTPKTDTRTLKDFLDSGAYVVLDSSVLFVVPGENRQQLSGKVIFDPRKNYRSLEVPALERFVDRLKFEQGLLKNGRAIVPLGVYKECSRAQMKLLYRRRDYEITKSPCNQRNLFLHACRLADENMLLMADRVPFVRPKPNFIALRDLCRSYTEHLNIKKGADWDQDERVDEDVWQRYNKADPQHLRTITQGFHSEPRAEFMHE